MNCCGYTCPPVGTHGSCVLQNYGIMQHVCTSDITRTHGPCVPTDGIRPFADIHKTFTDMKTRNKHFTPDNVTQLSRCEVFVFGSNLDGRHDGGAARTAYEKFGAEWGVGDGPTGQCYAIPVAHTNLELMQPYVDRFIEYAKAHPMNRFLLTRIGCGRAGHSDFDMAALFRGCVGISNISYPRQWLPSLLVDVTLGIDTPDDPELQPRVITESGLKRLCRKYLYEIGAGYTNRLPRIYVRYVAECGKFGYARFGNFFFNGDEFYVWLTDDSRADGHDQAVVLDTFGDECDGRGYACKAIFAGVRTRFKDTTGDNIYTGDVLNVSEHGHRRSYVLALGTLEDLEGNGEYAFMLDNHSLYLNDELCKQYRMKRIGTVFYKLNADGPVVEVRERAYNFNLHDTFNDGALLAKFTPNFDQEDWKYQALEAIGAEYNWKK